MKPQDILFILLLLVLLYRRDPRLFVLAGLGCFVLSMPLFHFWVFFTAERLVWYGGGLLLVGILFLLGQKRG